MKVKDLIKALQACDPEADVNFQVGANDAYRKTIADFVMKDDGTAENDGLAVLRNMCVSMMKQTKYIEPDISDVLIILNQDYYTYDFFEEQVVSGIVDNKFDKKSKEV